MHVNRFRLLWCGNSMNWLSMQWHWIGMLVRWQTKDDNNDKKIQTTKKNEVTNKRVKKKRTNELMQGQSYFLRLGKAGIFMAYNGNDLLNVFTQNIRIESRTTERKCSPEKRVQSILRCIMQPNPKLNAYTNLLGICVRAPIAHKRTRSYD